MISCPIDLQGKSVKLSLNVDGVSNTGGSATVEMLTEQFKPIPNFSGQNSLPITTAGLRIPVVFGTADCNSRAFEATSGRVRVKVSVAGVRPEDVKLYAIYVDVATLDDAYIPGLYQPPNDEVDALDEVDSVALHRDWQDSWDQLVEDLVEMGFEDRHECRIAVAQNQGELKSTVAALMRAERSRH